MKHTAQQNTTVSFSFEGTKLTLYRTMTVGGGPMEMRIDGTRETAQNYSATTLWQ
jgi:hypothetical protein